MKKFFTLLAAILCTLNLLATDYTDELSVNVYGATTTQEATISLDEQPDGKYTLALKNFMFSGLGVGNIIVTDIEGTKDAQGILSLSVNKTIQIAAGDAPGVDYWMGPSLGDVPVSILGKQAGDKLYAKIDINMTMLGLPLTVNVVFGNEGNITTGIEAIRQQETVDMNEVYNLDGTRASEMIKGRVYIVRKSDGTTRKIIK